LKYDVTDILTQGQGSLYCEFDCLGVDSGVSARIFELGDGTSANRILAHHYDTGTIRLIIGNNSSTVVNATTPSSYDFNTPHKILITYEDDNVNMYVDGAKTNTDTSATIPTVLKYLNIGKDEGSSNQLNGHIKNIKYYREVLSESRAKSLTRL
jgi:hypothetical protein